MRKETKKLAVETLGTAKNPDERVGDGWAAKVTALPEKKGASFKRVSRRLLVNHGFVANGFGSDSIIESRDGHDDASFDVPPRTSHGERPWTACMIRGRSDRQAY